MPMKQPVWTQPYGVNTLVLTPDRRLGLVGLLNILQDAAWSHARHLGHGYEAMIARGAIWVLTRQRLEMAAWPAWGDRVRVRTWIRPLTGPLAHRDYEILSGRRRIGAATASWLTIDAVTRRPLKLGLEDLAVCGDRCLPQIPAKLPLRNDLQPQATFPVRNSDLDVNGHVNNTRYAQWILDAIPREAHRAWRLDGYEINFLAETGVGDRVAILRGDGAEDGGVPFEGRRDPDGKPVFAARLHVTRIPG